jgi:hypothetical protein
MTDRLTGWLVTLCYVLVTSAALGVHLKADSQLSFLMLCVFLFCALAILGVAALAGWRRNAGGHIWRPAARAALGASGLVLIKWKWSSLACSPPEREDANDGAMLAVFSAAPLLALLVIHQTSALFRGVREMISRRTTRRTASVAHAPKPAA